MKKTTTTNLINPKKIKGMLLTGAAISVIGIGIYTQDNVYAHHYSPWAIISASKPYDVPFLYNGGKPMYSIQQKITYRRTYVDNGGRVSYEYKTEIKKLGIKPRY